MGRMIVLAGGLFAVGVLSSRAASPMFVGLGDSISEGVQSADANALTQPCSFVNLVARQAGAGLPLPLISVSPVGVVGDTTFRRRLAPYERGLNLAVSGADVASILDDRADAQRPGQANTETDLVLFPRANSQVGVAEALAAPLMTCWIGNNDVLGAVIEFNHLDASQLTPIPEFSAHFQEVVTRLTAGGRRVVFANIPAVTNIAFLADRDDLIRFLGSDFDLPDGHFTSIAAIGMVMLGLADGGIFHDPAYVLDPSELQRIGEQVAAMNQVIAETAAAAGMPVVDAQGIFNEMAINPPVFRGVPLTRRYLGGLFSLDGVHPSNIAHALVANAFIAAMNEHFGASMPPLSANELDEIFMRDPFVDKDEDGRGTGRPGAGLLETLAPFLGLSGDVNDWVPHPPAALQPEEFMRKYAALTGRGPAAGKPWTRADGVAALRHLFGIDRIVRSSAGSAPPGAPVVRRLR